VLENIGNFPQEAEPDHQEPEEGYQVEPFYNFLSDEERRLFTTKPKEVTA
jgi:hypothetical protein